eukprot:2256974-Pleurochrysis_carterae.AAC.2
MGQHPRHTTSRFGRHTRKARPPGVEAPLATGVTGEPNARASAELITEEGPPSPVIAGDDWEGFNAAALGFNAAAFGRPWKAPRTPRNAQTLN